MSPTDRAIARLTAVYGEPKTTDPEMFLTEFAKALEGSDPAFIDKAIDQWMRKDTPFWPRPGELLAEIKRVALDPLTRHHRRPAEHQPIETRQRSLEEVARVRALVADAVRAMAAGKIDQEDKPQPDWARGQRDGFHAMQENSPSGLHRVASLTPLSCRMTGESAE